MGDPRRAGIVGDAVRGWRVGDRNTLAHAIEMRQQIVPLPALGPGIVEHLLRVGLEQHAVEHAVAAEPDALKGERRLGELIGCAERHVRDLRIFARDIEDRRAASAARQPGRNIGAADRRSGRPAGLDDQDALATLAGGLEPRRDNGARGPAADDDDVVPAGGTGDGPSRK